MKEVSLAHLEEVLAVQLDWEAKGLPNPLEVSLEGAEEPATDAVEEIGMELHAMDDDLTLMTGLPKPAGERLPLFMLGMTLMMGGHPMAYASEQGGAPFRLFQHKPTKTSYRDPSENPMGTYGGRHQITPDMVLLTAEGAVPALLICSRLQDAVDDLEDWVIDALREPDYLLDGKARPVLTSNADDGLWDMHLDLKRMTPQTKTCELALTLLHRTLWSASTKVHLAEGQVLFANPKRVAMTRPRWPQAEVPENVGVIALASAFEFPHKWAADPSREWVVEGA